MYPNNTNEGWTHAAGWAPSGIGSAGTITADVPGSPLIDEATQSIESAVAQVQEIAASLWKYGDATLGPVNSIGQSAANALNPPKPNTRAGTLRERLDALHTAIASLHGAANRIHAI